MNQDLVKQLIDEAIAENPSLFLISWKISTGDAIEVLVDGDEGVSIEEIVRISRHIEHNLDREEFDFSLNVSSFGVGSHLELPRQYCKNIGRVLSILTIDGKEFEGEIKEADENSVLITWEAREPKPIGKGKHTVQKEQSFNLSEIKKAIVKITF